MAIKILIRKQRMSPYKRAIEEMIDIDGDTLIIATGYINNSNYNNEICIENLAKCILKNISNRKLYIKVFCGYGTDTEKQAKDFCYNLKKAVKNPNLKIELYLSNNMKWHGKVYIKKDENNNYAALIGSSNFTPVNLLENSRYFNIESDIYILNKKLIKDKKDFDEIKVNLNIINEKIEEIKKEISVLAFDLYKIIQKEKVNKEKGLEYTLRANIKNAENAKIKESCKKHRDDINDKNIKLTESEELKSLNILENIESLSYEIDELDEFINLIKEINLYEKKIDILQYCYKENGDIDRKKIVENIKKIKQNRLDLEDNNILEKYTNLLKLYDKYMISYDIQLMGYKTKDLIDVISFKIEEILSNKDMVRLCEDWDE